jgi:pimeloyl-ACP methyl ester carboxylesterase
MHWASRVRFAIVAALCGLVLGACDPSLDTARQLLDDLQAQGGPSPLKIHQSNIGHISVPDLGDIYSAPKPIRRLIFLRAYGDPLSDGQAVNIALSLARIGFEVLLPDLAPSLLPPANAGSKITAIADRFLNLEGSTSTGKIVIIASSLAGYAAMDAAIARPQAIAGMMLLGTPDDLSKTVRTLAKGDAFRAPQRRLIWLGVAGLARQILPAADQILVAGIAAKRADGIEVPLPQGTLSKQSLGLLAAAEQGDPAASPELTALVQELRFKRPAPDVPVIALYGRDDMLGSPDEGQAAAQTLGLDRDSLIILDGIADPVRGLQPSRADRRAWLKAFAILLRWRDGQ